MINYILTYITIEKTFSIETIFYNINVFDKTNAALVSMRDFFK